MKRRKDWHENDQIVSSLKKHAVEFVKVTNHRLKKKFLTGRPRIESLRMVTWSVVALVSQDWVSTSVYERQQQGGRSPL